MQVTRTKEDQELRDMLQNAVNIAIVGLSRDPEADSRMVAEYLRNVGYHIIPVNPNVQELMNEKSYPSLAEVPDPIDIVNIFRKSEDVPPAVQDAIQINAKVVWMQTGIKNEDAAREAEDAGLIVVQDRCIMVEHRRLFGSKE